jgi:hypothetical protein
MIKGAVLTIDGVQFGVTEVPNLASLDFVFKAAMRKLRKLANQELNSIPLVLVAQRRDGTWRHFADPSDGLTPELLNKIPKSIEWKSWPLRTFRPQS